MCKTGSFTRKIKKYVRKPRKLNVIKQEEDIVDTRPGSEIPPPIPMDVSMVNKANILYSEYEKTLASPTDKN